MLYWRFRPPCVQLTIPMHLGRIGHLNTLVHAKITALGTYVPPRLLTNADLEKMVETSDEWIMSRTGIRERHIVDKGMATSDLAVEAGKCALAELGSS